MHYFLSGPSGIGKTRFGNWLANRGYDHVLVDPGDGSFRLPRELIDPWQRRDFEGIANELDNRAKAQGKAKGFRVVDAPVSGGDVGAINATLSIMVGGDPDDVAAALPILESVGKTIVHVGPAGAGQTVKAANQLIVAGTIELVAESIVVLEAYGVDMPAAIKVLAGGLAGNQILERKAAGMLKREFAPGFRIDLHHKDMGIVTSAAREAGVAIPLGALTAQLVGAARAQGHGSLDHSALLLLVEQLSGRSSDDTGSTTKEA